MIMRAVLLFLMAGAAALPAVAYAQTAKTDTYIHVGRLLDKPGHPARGPSTIIVRDGKVVEVRAGFAPAPTSALLIDLSTKFVLPGLIDSHVHLRSDAGGIAGLVEGLTQSEAAGAYVTADNARKTLMAGFTTVRNLGDGGSTLALRDAIAKGIAIGPRIIDAGRSISTTGGHMDGRSGLSPFIADHIGDENLCDGVESCRQAVRIQIRRGADVIKIATTGGVNSGTGRRKMAFDDEIKVLVDTAHMYGRKIAAHAHGVEGVNAALAAGVDSIEHGTEIDDRTIALFKKSGAYYVPTLSTVNGYIERLKANPNAYEPKVLEQIRWRIAITGKSVQRAYPAGVRIAFGTDAGVSKHGQNADEFEMLVKFGMPPAAAIEAATVTAAKLLGVDGEVGTLEPGKAADLIAVSGDPLTDVTVLKTVPFVMKGGTVFKQ
jgi:imidazolonepropionase-like amidohydrolase